MNTQLNFEEVVSMLDLNALDYVDCDTLDDYYDGDDYEFVMIDELLKDVKSKLHSAKLDDDRQYIIVDTEELENF